MAGIQWMQCQYLAKGVGVRATCLFLTLTLQTLIISHISLLFYDLFLTQKTHFNFCHFHQNFQTVNKFF